MPELEELGIKLLLLYNPVPELHKYAYKMLIYWCCWKLKVWIYVPLIALQA